MPWQTLKVQPCVKVSTAMPCTAMQPGHMWHSCALTAASGADDRTPKHHCLSDRASQQTKLLSLATLHSPVSGRGCCRVALPELKVSLAAATSSRMRQRACALHASGATRGANSCVVRTVPA